MVKAAGASVSGFKTGDIVSLIPPSNISRWGTYLVEQAKLTAGDFVIITAASSSVGMAAFQIAKAVGATTIATTRTRAKREALIAHGADHVVVTAEENLVARVMEITSGVGARVVFDPVGGPSLIPLTESMARGGILQEYSALSTEPTPFPLFTVLSKSLTVKGYLNGEITNNDAALERAKDFITKGLTSGQLKPVIARIFPREQIQRGDALSRIQRSDWQGSRQCLIIRFGRRQRLNCSTDCIERFHCEPRVAPADTVD